MGKLQIIHEVEKEYLKDIPEFNTGDSLDIHFKIVESGKERVQIFSGVVIATDGEGTSKTVTLYRIAYANNMKRVFFLHNPNIVEIKVTKRGVARRSKIYNLLGKVGKASRIKEKRLKKKD